jgi:hypothetical protein
MIAEHTNQRGNIHKEAQRIEYTSMICDERLSRFLLSTRGADHAFFRGQRAVADASAYLAALFSSLAALPKFAMQSRGRCP